MTAIDPDLVAVLASSSTVLAAMLALGSKRSMLERRPRERCPACGRFIEQGRCGCPD